MLINQKLLLILISEIIFCYLTSIKCLYHNRTGSEFVKGKICIGTNGRMSVPSNREHHYRNLRERYTNCTYVDGNLELTWLQDENLDLSFLQYIREVTGYVLISHVDIKRIVLPRLQIIRGRTLFKMNFKDDEYALLVILSKMFLLELPALRDILSGSVLILNNYNLCHVKTISWKEIITDPKGRLHYAYNLTTPERECPPCHESCDGGCWGPGPENCQKFSKDNCSPQCFQGRCFGSNPRECCHLFCAGGCTGPKQSDCLACRNFYDDGVCMQECPPMQVYNPITYSWEPNPKGKYAYGATCVKKCPEHLLKDNGACVKNCPFNKKSVDGECVPCIGPCPKTCAGDVLIHSGNIDNFKNCTIIEGWISILDTTFAGFQQVNLNFTFGQRYDKLDPDRLEVFSTLKEVTGYINIQADHEKFKNLSFFRNLEVIGGRTLTEYFSSLYIVRTSLTSLGLKSLKLINSGAIMILENKNLCFGENINWTKIRYPTSQHMVYLLNNRNITECKAENLTCDVECKDGCWGPGSDQCQSCLHFRLNDTCLRNCSMAKGVYTANSSTCMPCHEQCGSSCSGPGPDHCHTCKHVRDGAFCVPKCSITKYEQNSECLKCHENCVDGCTGPHNTIGLHGCNSCEKAILNGDQMIMKCLKMNETCPTGYYSEWILLQEQGLLKPLAGKMICRKCHPRCKMCTGYGFHEQVCQICARYKKGEQCEDECPLDHFINETTNVCKPCHQQCSGCNGPHDFNCVRCRNYKVYLTGPYGNELDGSIHDEITNETIFRCVDTCPQDIHYKIFPEDNNEPYCSSEPIGSMSYRIGEAEINPKIMVFIFLILIIFIVMLVTTIILHWKRKVKNKENAMKMTMALTGFDQENEPLRPTSAKPNLAKLRIVKEADIRRGGFVGSGAFGKVFIGVWGADNDTNKIPVAIKVLHEENNPNKTQEFLEEAYIMASVDHPNLLQLLAVCMTSEMMLVTQLMPLGCLLDFVRTNRNIIGSKSMLNWCCQIAKGMAYLEERRLVHRDLAARNILVQSPTCIKITDFGLAKLLDVDEEEYKSAGGKMPIKWLALECIQHRIFTHKSDVWAFGVTIWEILTFGGKPYEHVAVRDVPELLEKGERLPQPDICTIDIYVVMVKCWMLAAESRPSFRELVEVFSKMCRDPGRYLVIEGDKFLKKPYFITQNKEIIKNLTLLINDSNNIQSETDEFLQKLLNGGNKISFSTTGNSSSSDSNSIASSIKTHWMNGIVQNGSLTESSQCNRFLPISATSTATNSLCNRHNTPDSQSIDCFDSGIGLNKQNLPSLKLPLDEDDYLMPLSPQQNQAITSYMDLIGDTRGGDTHIEKSYPDFLPKITIDNPEYLMNVTENNIPTQTLGIPIVTMTNHQYYNQIELVQRKESLQKQSLRNNAATSV